MNWYNNNYLYRKKITIDHTKVANDFGSFPVYIDLSTLADDFWNYVQNGGGDIRITASDMVTELAREIVSCNTATKKGEVYVLVNGLMSSTNTDIYIYYGNPSANDYPRTSTYGSNNVWGANAKAIYHTNNNYNDSSLNQKNLIGYNSPTFIDGKIGKALSLNGTNQYARLESSNPIIPNMSSSTMSCWVKSTSATGGANVMLKAYGSTNGGRSGTLAARAGGQAKYTIVHTSTPNISYDATSYPTNISIDTWYYVVGTYDINTGNLFLYLNGVRGSVVNNPYRDTSSGTSRFQVGTEQDTATPGYFAGQVCSMKIWSNVRTQEEIITEYNNQSSPSTFYSSSASEVLSVAAPVPTFFSN